MLAKGKTGFARHVVCRRALVRVRSGRALAGVLSSHSLSHHVGFSAKSNHGNATASNGARRGTPIATLRSVIRLPAGQSAATEMQNADRRPPSGLLGGAGRPPGGSKKRPSAKAAGEASSAARNGPVVPLVPSLYLHSPTTPSQCVGMNAFFDALYCSAA